MLQQKEISHLVALAKKNNRMAQLQLFHLYHQELIGVSKRITGRLEESEDIIQESFITAFSKLKTLQEPHKFPGWIKRIVINKSLAYLKQNKFYFSLAEEENFIPETEESNWLEEVAFNQIQEEIDKLPNGSKQIFVLYLLENYKHHEIAEILQISVSTSKSQYQYALKTLRKNLKGVFV